MPTPASEFRRSNRKEVTLPSGHSVLLKKLTGEFLFVIQELAENSLSLAEDSAGKTFRMPAKDQREYLHRLVMESVVEPKVVPSTQQPKDDEMWVSDFGADLDPLVNAINEYNSDVLKVPFRTQENRQDVPPTSDDVRRESEPVAEAAA